MSTWNEIVKANESIRTTDIKGKEYAEVNQRIKAFRMVHPDGCIETEIVSLENGICVMRVEVSDAEGNVLGTGTAYEKETSSYINKTSYIENCETSAVGRALGMCGFGIDTSVASYEEVDNAIQQQEKMKNQPKEEPPSISARDKLIYCLNQKGIDANEYAKTHNLTKESTDEDYTRCLIELSKGVQ